MWPLMEVDDLVGATFLPTDGQAAPSDITQSLAKGARTARREALSRASPAPASRSKDGRVVAVETDARHDRLREGGDLRRHVVAADRRAGRRQRAAAAGQAPVRHHREDRRPRRRHGDHPRSRPAHLLQGGGRRPRLRRLRAEPDCLDHRRRAGALRVPACSTTTGIISSSTWRRRSRASRRSKRPASSR